MYFDGATNALGHGIGIILISPYGHYYPITTRLNFNCTNNVAEYEELLAKLRVTKELGDDEVKVFSDFQLVVS